MDSRTVRILGNIASFVVDNTLDEGCKFRIQAEKAVVMGELRLTLISVGFAGEGNRGFTWFAVSRNHWALTNDVKPRYEQSRRNLRDVLREA